ncbi:unnamed protein product [Gongylonema pulchrum]|uniref:Apple domain-containing protein n=1 Tax=Gongylonema pulchrum TaxID=637853 RepID=A0A183D0A4_9BILA|nr:unnamed protein product [Gongylonema pulchrum]
MCLIIVTSLLKKYRADELESLLNPNSASDRQTVNFGSSFSEDSPRGVISLTAAEAGDQVHPIGFASKSNKLPEFPKNELEDSISKQQRDFILGLPNLTDPFPGDPCFRNYEDYIIVNAQPYERRSKMVLQQCKQRCMQSQTGIYSCRFVIYLRIKAINYQQSKLFCSCTVAELANGVIIETEHYSNPYNERSAGGGGKAGKL